MTFDEAMALGIQLSRERKWDEALHLFLQVQNAFPDNLDTHRVVGQVFHAMGEPVKAVPYLAEALRRNQDAASVYDLMTVLVASGNVSEIDVICRQYRSVVWSDARLLAAWGHNLVYLRRCAEAVEVLRQALALSPVDRGIRHNLSAALVGAGQEEEAVEVFSTLTTPQGGEGGGSPGTAFLDGIAEGYDDNELHQYFGLRLMRLYHGAFPVRPVGRALDLGCGSGLLAGHLSGTVTALVGIDRSPAMLAQARQRNLYNQVIEGDMPAILDRIEGPFDTILSACVLYYFPDLAPFFRHAGRLLSPGGAFVFSVDPVTDVDEVRVTGPGEYAHSRAYLRRLAAEYGFEVVTIEIDRHRGPPGFWCAFRKA